MAVSGLNETAKGKKVVIWGAGRIFSAMLKNGFDGNRVWLVDTYLKERLGFKVNQPRDLEFIVPDLIVVASREYQEEIKEQARALLPKVEVIGWDEYL